MSEKSIMSLNLSGVPAGVCLRRERFSVKGINFKKQTFGKIRSKCDRFFPI